MFAEREFFIDNLLVRIHFIILMIRWTGLAPWEFEFPFRRYPTIKLFKGVKSNKNLKKPVDYPGTLNPEPQLLNLKP